MAENKVGLGTIIAAGVAVAAVAGGIAAAYVKREELKKLAEEVVAKMRPVEDDEGVCEADIDDDGVADIVFADTDGDGQVDTIMMDTDGDGMADKACVDVDGDGVPDVEVDIAPADDCEEDVGAEHAEAVADEVVEAAE